MICRGYSLSWVGIVGLCIFAFIREYFFEALGDGCPSPDAGVLQRGLSGGSCGVALSVWFGDGGTEEQDRRPSRR